MAATAKVVTATVTVAAVVAVVAAMVTAAAAVVAVAEAKVVSEGVVLARGVVVVVTAASRNTALALGMRRMTSRLHTVPMPRLLQELCRCKHRHTHRQ